MSGNLVSRKQILRNIEKLLVQWGSSRAHGAVTIRVRDGKVTVIETQQTHVPDAETLTA